MKRTIIVLTSLACAAAAPAHEFWIELSSYDAEPDEIVTSSFMLGQRLVGSPVPRDASHIDRFVMLGHDEQDVLGRDGSLVTGFIRGSTPGAEIVALETNPAEVTLGPTMFVDYLHDHALDSVIRQLQTRGGPAEQNHERFSRCAKSILRVGGQSTGFDRRAGLTFEITPVTDPFDPGAASVRFIVEFEGEPAADVLVFATPRLDPAHPLLGRTDSHGMVDLDTNVECVWLISALIMNAATSAEDVAAGAQWRSHWASLTFEAPPRAQ